jgi:cardiolipin synthase
MMDLSSITQLVGIVSSIGLGILLVIFGILTTFYLQGAFRNPVRYRLRNLPRPEADHFACFAASLSDSFLTTGKTIGFWLGADEIFGARLAFIQQAQQTIWFETFWMTPGRRSANFAEAIASRARAGVAVQMIVDHHGTETMPAEYWQNLQQAGVEVRFFNPFSWRSPLDYLDRTHRKLLLIDGKTALIGGAGVSDMWDGEASIDQSTPWLDFEVGFQGKVLRRLEGIFLQHWLDAGGTLDMAEGWIPPDCPNSTATVLVTSGEDPTHRNSDIRAFFLSLIYAARQRIWITSPYLLPNSDSRRALLLARQRGVDVRIVTMGHCNDKPYVYYTSRELYGHLLEVGVKLYEYQPSMMHAKLILLDDHWMSLGSANLDPRSFFHNDELNLSSNEPELLQKVEAFFQIAFSSSQLVNLKEWQQRSLPHRLAGQIGLLFRQQF